MSVSAKRAATENERLKAHGIKCAHYDEKGNFYATSKKAANQAQRIRNIMNLDAGYGDYAGR